MGPRSTSAGLDNWRLDLSLTWMMLTFMAFVPRLKNSLTLLQPTRYIGFAYETALALDHLVSFLAQNLSRFPKLAAGAQ